MSLKEHGTGQAAEGRGHGWIEPFQVAGGDDAAEAMGLGIEFVGLIERGGEWLFDEQVKAGGEELRGDFGVRYGGDTNGRGVKVEVGREQIADGGEGGNAMMSGDLRADFGVGVDGGHQLRGERVWFSSEFRVCRVLSSGFVGRGQVVKHAQVVAAEGTGTDDSYANRRLHDYLVLTGVSTALRQRA